MSKMKGYRIAKLELKLRSTKPKLTVNLLSSQFFLPLGPHKQAQPQVGSTSSYRDQTGASSLRTAEPEATQSHNHQQKLWVLVCCHLIERSFMNRTLTGWHLMNDWAFSQPEWRHGSQLGRMESDHLRSESQAPG